MEKQFELVGGIAELSCGHYAPFVEYHGGPKDGQKYVGSHCDTLAEADEALIVFMKEVMNILQNSKSVKEVTFTDLTKAENTSLH